VNYTGSNTRDESHQVEDTIQNGVKNTSPTFTKFMSGVEETIQNGVKETIYRQMGVVPVVENTIQNGVRHTMWSNDDDDVEDAIGNGVKHTEYGDWLDGDERFDDIIQNGVKHTVASDCLPSVFVEDTIENGVKETKTPGADGDIIGAADFMSDNNTNNLSHLINDVIEHGVKLTNSSLQIDGSCVVEDVIQNGIKETHDDVYHHKGRVGGVIKNGIKETKLIDYSDNTEFIVNGVISRGTSI
jgi:predicted peroxiredoxin